MAISGTVGFADSKSITTESPDFADCSFAEEVVLGAEEVAAIVATTMTSGSLGHTFDVLLCEKFRTLGKRWRAETIQISSLTDIESHAAYQEIINTGQGVIPLILWELVNDPDWWFMALDALVEVPPATEGDEGNLMALSAKWIEWGKSNGYLPGTQ